MLWRRLRRLGALSMAGGASVLPARRECVEAFGWIAQEVAEATGEIVLMRVGGFDGPSDAELIEGFRAARRNDYVELDARVDLLEQEVAKHSEATAWPRHRETLANLHRRHAEIARIDYFHAPEGTQMGARLARIAGRRTSGDSGAAQIEPVAITMLRGARWATRPRPHVDRLACV